MLHCIGAPLARTEARIAFEEFFTRVPDYEIIGPVTRLGTREEQRGIASLPGATEEWRTVVIVGGAAYVGEPGPEPTAPQEALLVASGAPNRQLKRRAPTRVMENVLARGPQVGSSAPALLKTPGFFGFRAKRGKLETPGCRRSRIR